MGEATQIREIFTTWTYANETNNPEMIFESKLKTNPTHPFIPLSEKKGTFVHKKRSRKILAGVLTIIVAVAIFVTVYLTQNGSLQGVGASIYSIPALVGLWGILLVFLNLEVRRLILTSSWVLKETTGRNFWRFPDMNNCKFTRVRCIPRC